MDRKWETIALQAFDIAYTPQGDKKNIDQQTQDHAVSLFYDSIAAGADKYWPYIKLADLITDKKEQIKLYIQAFRVEPNDYSIKYLFDQILLDHPAILDSYLL